MKYLKLPKSSVGAWCTVGHPLVAEAVLSSGVYDWMTIDDEHCAFTESEMMHVLQMCDQFGILGLVRVRIPEIILARKALDFGAHGLLLPMIESAEQVQKIADHIYYPPEGRRGVCLARINGWGVDFDDYMKNFKPVLIAQIESQAGVDNIDEILSVPNLTGIFLGPFDLSASLGKAGDFTTPKFIAAAEKVKQATLRHGKALGIHVVQPNVDELDRRRAEGYNFIAYGTDLICLRSSLDTLRQRILKARTT